MAWHVATLGFSCCLLVCCFGLSNLVSYFPKFCVGISFYIFWAIQLLAVLGKMIFIYFYVWFRLENFLVNAPQTVCATAGHQGFSGDKLRCLLILGAPL